MVKCQVCGKEFIKRRGNSQACSNRCTQNRCVRNSRGADMRDPEYILKLLLKYEKDENENNTI